MRYESLTIICEGAFEEEVTFFDYALRNEYLRDLAKEAESSGAEFEVYILDHYHDPLDDCECSQFATDHKPRYVFPDNAGDVLGTARN